VPPWETVPADDQVAAGRNGAERDGTPSVPVDRPARGTHVFAPPAHVPGFLPHPSTTAARPGGVDVPASALLAGRSGWADRQRMAPNRPSVLRRPRGCRENDRPCQQPGTDSPTEFPALQGAWLPGVAHPPTKECPMVTHMPDAAIWLIPVAKLISIRISIRFGWKRS
jgi:hypothetical protein